MEARRAYTMRARAMAAEATRQRILEAAVDLLRARFRSDIRLEDIAGHAQVSVQTVLRVFGSRSALLDLAIQEALRQIAAQFDQAQPGDVEGSVAAWFDHYEQLGDLVVRNLADEADPAVRPMVQTGRRRHRRRVERQFGPQLARVTARERTRLMDALTCACDVYTWKLLRRDLGRSRFQAESTVCLMVKALLEGG